MVGHTPHGRRTPHTRRASAAALRPSAASRPHGPDRAGRMRDLGFVSFLSILFIDNHDVTPISLLSKQHTPFGNATRGKGAPRTIQSVEIIQRCDSEAQSTDR